MARHRRRHSHRRGITGLGSIKGTLTSIAAAATGVGVGFGSFVDQATKKWRAGYTQNTTIDAKFFDAIASFIGNSTTKAISQAVGMPWNGAADFHINPLGVLNSFTGTGIALLVGDGLMKSVARKFGFSGSYSAPGKFVRASGAGALFGGIVGGLADDPQPAQTSGYNYQIALQRQTGPSVWGVLSRG